MMQIVSYCRRLTVVLIGIIDFGDSVYTWTINDIAIAICYALISEYGRNNAISTITFLLGELPISLSRGHNITRIFYIGGYLSQLSLTKQELKHLKVLIACRLSISISVGAYSIYKDPTNEYLKLHAIPARKTLTMLWNIDTNGFYQLCCDVSTSVQKKDVEFYDILKEVVKLHDYLVNT